MFNARRIGTAKTRSSQNTPARALEKGQQEVKTSLGFLLYLTLITLYRDMPDKPAADGQEAVPAPALNSADWNCSSDEEKYVMLLGDWCILTEFGYSRAEKSSKFSVEIPSLVLASANTDARRVTDELVRIERAQFTAPELTPAEEEFVQFLTNCLTYMGHLITGTVQESYAQRLMNAFEAQTTDVGCALHELLRKEAQTMWLALSPDALAERTKPLWQVMKDAEIMSGFERNGHRRSAGTLLRGRSMK